MKILIAVAVGAGLVYLGARMMAKLYAEIEYDVLDDWDDWTEAEFGEWYGDEA